MRHTLAFISVIILTAACSTTPKNHKSFESAEELLNSSKEDIDYRPYVTKFIASQNQQRLDDDSGCYKIEKGTKVELILTVNKDGIISNADTSSDTNKAKCFRKAYIGAKMPTPPFAPIAIKLNMN